MLRRKPTLIALDSSDLALFEHTYAQKRAMKKTGQAQTFDARSPSYDEDVGMIDPNDELKPLPGDKAKIVRSREERIMGRSGNASGASGVGR